MSALDPSGDTALDLDVSGLTQSQRRIVASVARALKLAVEFHGNKASDLVDERWAEVMGNFLVLHHALHEEPLNKKPFEYVFKRCLIAQGHNAQLNPTPGQYAYDIEGNGIRWSLKTEAAKGISARQVKIEKFMEARWIRECKTPEACAVEVRTRLSRHIGGYDRIAMLRAFVRSEATIYRLEEIPVSLLLECFSNAAPDMFTKNEKRNSPSFGADFYPPGTASRAFRILLDSSVEKIRLWYQTDHCIHHGTWIIPRVGDDRAIELYASTS
ncbi:hypothetical protein [Nonomuraea fuscirosea]|uniref:hypothetical protein n=1 Tax=Nonomuraea fuscirosea TaxID=1291556 RepID=UPI0034451DF9